MNADRRAANVTDALRLLGALCVVWYHNPLYWNLQGHLASVDTVKMVVLGWSMPFFYATSARFAFTGKSPARLLPRMATLLGLVIFYTALYELAHWRSETGLVARCLGDAGGCSASLVFDTLRNVGNTPGYYLSDLLSMYLLACLAGISPALGWIMAGAAWIALLLGQVKLGGLFLNPLALGCLSVALLYRLLLAPRLRAMPRLRLPAPMVLPLLALLPLVWGAANVLLAQNDYWRDTGRIVLFGLLLLPFLAIDDGSESDSRLLAVLSRWGRQYAFGIFIFHQLCFDLLGARAAAWVQRLLHVQDELGLYLVAGVAATLAALALTALTRKMAPALLAS
ncbi:hypothetical protein J8I26_09710 [Herbaspirillum sp. LeCh32-8]|uniref:hypothetical protein n=1 Tax=Herbaspirillum sp. LeCh32-8 TaxID=2821356 RepID=UPI001AE84B70|nr:hypothetical protein [Herbaspirillum sp. LeCh32-8]MBP0598379.1 hypothetical protein [Herbaspirillum sp. LeCh32-8]